MLPDRATPDAVAQPEPTNAAVVLAAQAFRRFYASCFWSADPQLLITAESVPFVVRGLRENGGHAGYRAAAEILRCR